MGIIANQLFISLIQSIIKKGIDGGWERKVRKAPGNKGEYRLESVLTNSVNELSGKHIGYLGSSVTYGACSGAVSFVEYISKRNNTTFVKEAVSGTTLVNDSDDSYVARMKRMESTKPFDLFVVQLSTNDATQKKPLGALSENDKYDTHTIIGAMEYIITYVYKTWKCPVVFYTGSYYDSANYSEMVRALKDLAKKYPIGVIDMFEDKEFNDISKKDYQLYMFDPIHPTKAGYLNWWTPKMEKDLCAFIRSFEG